MRKFLQRALTVFLLGGSFGASADVARIVGTRLWASPESTRLVFDLSGPVAHNIETADDPLRVVIDVVNAQWAADLNKLRLGGSAIADVRQARRSNGTLRVALGLKRAVRVHSIVLKPNQDYGHRLVVDLDYATPARVLRTVAEATSATSSISASPSAKSASAKNKSAKAIAPSARSQVRATTVASIAAPTGIVIAIDAGHGGEDPGARGALGTHEKDVTLAVARRVAALLRAEKGIRPVLTRDGDYFIPLRKRMRLARQHKADLFLSIHADAARNSDATGSSVFTLSERGASSEAAHWLADKENAADLIGGVTLEDKDDTLASVLLDLSQTATSEASHAVGSEILRELKSVGDVHQPTVQYAAFAVLKSPDVPSVLVETAFITNPGEERKLRSLPQQEKIARAIVAGVRAYFRQHAPAGSMVASNHRHVISPGETLDAIAQRYQISVKALMESNNLSGRRVTAGQVLAIPGADS